MLKIAVSPKHNTFLFNPPQSSKTNPVSSKNQEAAGGNKNQFLFLSEREPIESQSNLDKPQVSSGSNVKDLGYAPNIKI